MDKEKLMANVSEDFPGGEPTHLFSAGIPVFFAQIQLEVLEPQELSSFEIYFLHAVALGVESREEMAWLLGLDDRDLVAPGASLLRRDYIVQGQPRGDGSRPIFLTEKGRQALGSKKAPPVPHHRRANLHFNALTWLPMPPEESPWSVEQMEKEGLAILPPARYERPTLGDFGLKEVALALRDVAGFEHREIVQLLSLKKVSPEYLAPVTVVVVGEQERGEQRLAVYRHQLLQRAESTALQRQFETGAFQIPDDAVALAANPLPVPATLPPAVARVARDLATSATSVQSLQQQLSGERARQGSATADRREREALEEHINRLQADLDARRAENERLLAELRRQHGEFLRTEEHRAILEQALREAQQEVLIVSPWMNTRVCDSRLCELVAQAVKRGVRVRIAYGTTERPGDPDAGRHRNNAARVIAALKAAVGREGAAQQATLLDIHKTGGTHQKILVCDRTFAVLGSFNWLSYRGEQDEEYRNETSILLHDRAAIEELARIAFEEWSSTL
jgi:hypothetical protein